MFWGGGGGVVLKGGVKGRGVVVLLSRELLELLHLSVRQLETRSLTRE